MNKVDFIVAGTQKGGTTALDSYLSQHNGICMASKKEVHFFDRDANFLQEDVDYSHYHSYFNEAQEGQVCGESTPIYMYWYDCPKRIWKYNRNMKWIFILRNPADRAYSHWNMGRDRGHENLSFSEAIRIEHERSKCERPLQHRRYSYVDRGFYFEQLRRIWHLFPQEQTLILRSEELRYQLEETLEKVATFLELSSFPKIEGENVHSREYIEKMSESDRLYLEDVYRYDIKQLERALDLKGLDWISKKKPSQLISALFSTVCLNRF